MAGQQLEPRIEKELVRVLQDEQTIDSSTDDAEGEGYHQYSFKRVCDTLLPRQKFAHICALGARGCAAAATGRLTFVQVGLLLSRSATYFRPGRLTFVQPGQLLSSSRVSWTKAGRPGQKPADLKSSQY